MKKLAGLFLALTMMIILAACGANQEDPETASNSQNQELAAAQGEDAANQGTSAPESGATEDHILIAYFSWADNAEITGEVDAVASPSVTEPGHVAQLASWVQEETDGDLFSIQVTEPYSSDWDECLERANQERSENARPALTATVDHIEDFDVVFLGYPNWWYGAPMALLSFIEENDLSDKQIYLFCSHGTGGLAGSVEDIQAVLPESAVLSEQVFDVYEEDAAASQADIQSWLEELGY